MVPSLLSILSISCSNLLPMIKCRGEAACLMSVHVIGSQIDVSFRALRANIESGVLYLIISYYILFII